MKQQQAVQPFRVPEITWSRHAEEKHANPGSGVRINTEQERQMKLIAASAFEETRYNVALTTPGDACVDETAVRNGVLRGSGVLVNVEGRAAVLTANHVFTGGGTSKDAFENGVVISQPTVFLNGNILRDNDGRGTIAGKALQIRPRGEEPASGLPDLALFIPQVQAAEARRLSKTGLPFDTDHCGAPDNTLGSCIWTVTGAVGEKSQAGFLRMEINTGLNVDRVYQRGSFEYLSLFLEQEGAPRMYGKNWHGTSGGGVWLHSLTPRATEKLRHGATPGPEDIRGPRLAGIAFYHSPARPEGRQTQPRPFNGELYAHRLTPEIIQWVIETVRSA